MSPIPTPRFKPSVTVAAVIQHHGRFLFVEEHTPEGVRFNQPAGHLERGESLVQASVREVREETARLFTPTALLGVYLGRFARVEQPETVSNDQANTPAAAPQDITYLRVAFLGTVSDELPGLRYDTEIIRTLWLTTAEVRANIAAHRSPLVQRCIDDALAGVRLPLDALVCDASVFGV
jgi:phosphatase NudJ